MLRTTRCSSDRESGIEGSSDSKGAGTESFVEEDVFWASEDLGDREVLGSFCGVSTSSLSVLVSDSSGTGLIGFIGGLLLSVLVSIAIGSVMVEFPWEFASGETSANIFFNRKVSAKVDSTGPSCMGVPTGFFGICGDGSC